MRVIAIGGCIIRVVKGIENNLQYRSKESGNKYRTPCRFGSALIGQHKFNPTINSRSVEGC